MDRSKSQVRMNLCDPSISGQELRMMKEAWENQPDGEEKSTLLWTINNEIDYRNSEGGHSEN